MGLLFEHIVQNDAANHICTKFNERLLGFPAPLAKLREFVGKHVCENLLNSPASRIKLLPKLFGEFLSQLLFPSSFESNSHALDIVLRTNVTLSKSNTQMR